MQFPIGMALAAGACLTASTLLSSPVKAQTSCNEGSTNCRIDLGEIINGASPAGLGPWLSLQIKDADDGVSILFTPMLSPGEFITKVGLSLTQAFQDSYEQQNLNPFAGLVATCAPDGSGVCVESGVVAQVDGYDIEGNAVGGFDLGFNFALRDNGNRLTSGKAVQFNLTGTALKTADLLGTITLKGLDGKDVEVNAAAKVQGIAPSGTNCPDTEADSGECSGVAAEPNGTPVPGPLPLLGAAAAFQTSRQLRRRLKVSAAIPPRSVCPPV